MKKKIPVQGPGAGIGKGVGAEGGDREQTHVLVLCKYIYSVHLH